MNLSYDRFKFMEQSLTSYRAFYETAQEGNISKAAEKLGVTQPAVSKAINKLEQGLGTKLFDRTQRGVSLTPEGDILFEHLRQAFYSIQLGEEELKKLADYEYGHLKIGSSSTLSKFFLMPYLKEFFDTYPYVKLTIEDVSTQAVISGLLAHKLDVGAVLLARPDPDVTFTKVVDIDDVFVCTPLYMKRLKEVYGPDVNVFEKANIMLLSQGHMSRKYIDDYLRAQSITPRRLLEFPTMDLLIDMAKINMGVSAVIREYVSMDLKEGRLIEIPLKAKIPVREAGFAYLASNRNPALKKFLKSITS